MSLEGEQHHVKMKVEIRMLFLQAEEHRRLPGNHQETRERQGLGSLSQPSEGSNPLDTFILNFQSPGLWGHTFPLILWIFVIAAWGNSYKVNKTSITNKSKYPGCQTRVCIMEKNNSRELQSTGRERGDSFIDGGQRNLLDRVTLDWGPRGRKRSEPCGYPQEEYSSNKEEKVQRP